jgi:eukaryotic-like serine/threonine-protein kinase
VADLLNQLSTALADRYRLERELGRGGMATVYLAQDLRHRRRVALKVLYPELAYALGADRFLREIEVAASLTHPHILPLHDSGEAAGLLYYVMPYVEGESLRDRLKRETQLPVDDALLIAREVADALAYAHRQGIIHRDIKPENILLSGGHALVADFGIARALGQAGAERLTETGIAVGTAAYMSPEQATGERQLDGRSDVYSLGCVLYEMLAGEPPYTGPTAHAIMARRLSDPVPQVRRLRPTVPQQVQGSLIKALAPVPADRFATAEQFAQAFGGQVMTQTATSALVDLPAATDGRKRMRLSRTAAPIFLLGLLVVAAFALLRRQQGPDFAEHGAAAQGRVAALQQDSVAAKSGKSIGVLPLVNVSGNPDDEYFSDGMTDELTGALSKVPGLRVASRTSAFTFKGRMDIDIRQIGEKLRVRTILEGSVRRAGSRLRITTQLINVGDGLTLWSDTYERDLQDLFKVQADIAQSIADALQLTLTGNEGRTFAAAGTRNLKAHDLYLRGRFFLDRVTEKDIRRGMELFKAALEEDSSYASAHAEMARAWMLLADDFIAPKEAWPRVQTAASRALELDSTLADPHTSLGAVLQWFEKDLPPAERHFRRAVKLNPSDANARFNLGRLLILTGRPNEGLVEYRKAVGLDPLSAMWQYGLAEALVWTDSTDAALTTARKALALDPNIGIAHQVLGTIYFAKGALAQAGAAFQRAEELGWVTGSFGRATVYALSGHADSARLIARRWESEAARRWVAPDLIAGIYATLGEREKAFRLLEKAYEERAGYLLMLQVRADLIPLRGDPRFAALVRKLGLVGVGREAS